MSNITNNLAGNQSESFDYVYDANSNRSSEIKKANGQAFRTVNYDYDKLNRLTKADYTANVSVPPNPPLGEQVQYTETTAQNNFGYDAVGNRTSETKRTQTKTVTLRTDANGTGRSEQVATTQAQVTTATFNELNELTKLTEPNAVSDFSYDRNGNLVEIKKNAAVTNRYEYDIRNQLTKAKDGANIELARFDYDFERKRISKTNAVGTTNYVYAGNQVVSEFANNANLANYTIGAGEIVKSEFSNGENNYHFTDALGSTTSLASAANGSLTSRNEYNAFGEVSTTANTANSIGYTGQRLDNETGLMPLGNGERYYSPSYARFIQQDSWLGDSSMPQSTNRFAYAYNNPNKYTDPSGNEPVTISVAGFLLISFLDGVAISVYQQDQQVQKGERRQEDFSMSEAWVDYTIIGTTYKAAVGQDVVTGRNLSKTERAIAVGETVLEFASVAGKVVGATSKSAKAASAGNLIGNAAEGTQAAIGVYRGGDATIDLIKRGEYSTAVLTGILTALSAYGSSQSYKGIKAELPKWKVMPPGIGIDGIGVPSVRFVDGVEDGVTKASSGIRNTGASESVGQVKLNRNQREILALSTSVKEWFWLEFGATSLISDRPLFFDNSLQFSPASNLVKNTSAQKIKICPSIHLPLDGFQAVDLPFGLTIAPI